MKDRTDWPSALTRLEDHESVYDTWDLTPQERILMMWPLAELSFDFQGDEDPDSRSPRAIAGLRKRTR